MLEVGTACGFSLALSWTSPYYSTKKSISKNERLDRAVSNCMNLWWNWREHYNRHESKMNQTTGLDSLDRLVRHKQVGDCNQTLPGYHESFTLTLLCSLLFLAFWILKQGTKQQRTNKNRSNSMGIWQVRPLFIWASLIYLDQQDPAALL